MSPGTRVLVIDDNDIDRASMVELLKAAGFETHDLPSPIGATRMARQLQAAVVIIDQQLPAMDGSKLAALFRSNAGTRSVRVVLVSGSQEQQMMQLVEQAQADAFVSKRELREKLVATVKQLTL